VGMSNHHRAGLFQLIQVLFATPVGFKTYQKGDSLGTR